MPAAAVGAAPRLPRVRRLTPRAPVAATVGTGLPPILVGPRLSYPILDAELAGLPEAEETPLPGRLARLPVLTRPAAVPGVLAARPAAVRRPDVRRALERAAAVLHAILPPDSSTVLTDYTLYGDSSGCRVSSSATDTSRHGGK